MVILKFFNNMPNKPNLNKNVDHIITKKLMISKPVADNCNLNQK